LKKNGGVNRGKKVRNKKGMKNGHKKKKKKKKKKASQSLSNVKVMLIVFI